MIIQQTKRDKKSFETMQKIFDTATYIIENEGLNQLTVKNICMLSGISNGTFFHYFQTKEELIIKYMHDGYDKYIQSHPFELKDGEYINNIIGLYLHNIQYCKTLTIEFIKCYYSADNKALNARNTDDIITGPCYDNVINQIKNAQKAGYFSQSESAFDITADLGMLVKGIIFEWAICDGKFDVDQNIKRFLLLFLNSIKYH